MLFNAFSIRVILEEFATLQVRPQNIFDLGSSLTSLGHVKSAFRAVWIRVALRTISGVPYMSLGSHCIVDVQGNLA